MQDLTWQDIGMIFLVLIGFGALIVGGMLVVVLHDRYKARQAQRSSQHNRRRSVRSPVMEAQREVALADELVGERSEGASSTLRQPPSPVAAEETPAGDIVAPRPATERPRLAVADPSAADLTRLLVAALPPVVEWPREEARLDHLPIFFDGSRWHALNATTSRHVVICGASRSGKGNLLQLLAFTVLAQGPDRASVWVLDAKGGLDYAALLPLEHARVYADVPAGANPFTGALSAGYRAALEELARRNQLLVNAGARNHLEYKRRVGRALPLLIIIADEVAELNDEQQRGLATLARMGAAAGIVVWAATQYPTAASLPTQIQSNALDRIVFQFPSPRYTVVALGLAPGERPTYEPAAIGQRGVAILRQDGRDVALGRVPYLSDEVREAALAELYGRYGRVSAPVPPAVPASSGTDTSPVTERVPVAVTPETATIASSAEGEAVVAPSGETGGESTIVSDDDRDELVRTLSSEGKSYRAIRAVLQARGLSMAQERLVQLYHEGRARNANATDAEQRVGTTTTAAAA